MGRRSRSRYPTADAYLLGDGLLPEEEPGGVPGLPRSPEETTQFLLENRDEAVRILAEAEKADVLFIRVLLKNPELQHTMTLHRSCSSLFLKKIGITDSRRCRGCWSRWGAIWVCAAVRWPPPSTFRPRSQRS
jgi:hypothetical protein